MMLQTKRQLVQDEITAHFLDLQSVLDQQRDAMLKDLDLRLGEQFDTCGREARMARQATYVKAVLDMALTEKKEQFLKVTLRVFY
jgi:hypothetical protein